MQVVNRDTLTMGLTPTSSQWIMGFLPPSNRLDATLGPPALGCLLEGGRKAN